jgi:hypothetical protein
MLECLLCVFFSPMLLPLSSALFYVYALAMDVISFSHPVSNSLTKKTITCIFHCISACALLHTCCLVKNEHSPARPTPAPASAMPATAPLPRGRTPYHSGGGSSSSNSSSGPVAAASTLIAAAAAPVDGPRVVMSRPASAGGNFRAADGRGDVRPGAGRYNDRERDRVPIPPVTARPSNRTPYQPPGSAAAAATGGAAVTLAVSTTIPAPRGAADGGSNRTHLGNSSGRDRDQHSHGAPHGRRVKQTRVEPDREQGVVSALKDGFGFIKFRNLFVV